VKILQKVLGGYFLTHRPGYAYGCVDQPLATW